MRYGNISGSQILNFLKKKEGKKLRHYLNYGCLCYNYRLYNLGLRQHTKASLLLELLTPTAFSIVIVIQLHFFHRPFLAMIDLRVRANSTAHQSAARGAVEPHIEPSTSQQDGAAPSEIQREPRISTQKSFLVVALVKIVNFYNDLTVFLWRVGELHMLKLVNLTLICVVLYQVSYFFFLLFVSTNMYMYIVEAGRSQTVEPVTVLKSL